MYKKESTKIAKGLGFRPTKAMILEASDLVKDVLEFDWSKHVQGNETPENARKRHYAKLQKEYADDPDNTGVSKRYSIPQFTTGLYPLALEERHECC